MSDYVVDASVALKWFVPESHSEAAWRLRNMDDRLHIPAFMMLEIGNALCKKVRRGEMTAAVADEILRALQQLPLHRHPDDLLFPAALRLAHTTRRSLYDCLYLALAIVIKGKLVTADRLFFTALAHGPLVSHLCWVEDVP